MRMKVVFIDQTLRFALEIDEEDGGHFVSIPVRNAMVEYDEWYEVDRATFDSYVADPARMASLPRRNAASWTIYCC